MKNNDTPDRPKLPWMEQDSVNASLRAAADKLEQGKPLLHGDAGLGSRYIERDIVVETLRAVAAGTPLGHVFRRGPRPTHHWGILKKVGEAEREHGSLSAAFAAVAKQEGKAEAAIKKAYQRARTKKRNIYREHFLSGAWPDWVYWDMTDEDIEREVLEDGFNYVDAQGQPVDMREQLRRRRDAEIADILDLTGWKSLPKREGQ